MLCTNCHNQEATFHLTTVLNGKAGQTAHLCEDCATAGGLPAMVETDPKALRSATP